MAEKKPIERLTGTQRTILNIVRDVLPAIDGAVYLSFKLSRQATLYAMDIEQHISDKFSAVAAALTAGYIAGVRYERYQRRKTAPIKKGTASITTATPLEYDLLNKFRSLTADEQNNVLRFLKLKCWDIPLYKCVREVQQ